MQLHRVRLVNFRQHADTELAFGPGVTGIIGPNGSGKTTLLEAIAWAIYGAPAARGDRDSVRNLRAKARSSVRVEVEFSLGKHEFRVVRGLHQAELYQDGHVVANASREVTDRLQRALGMTHDEFFNTYFTAQKELAVMASLSRPERAAFLARMLGYEKLDLAQVAVRETRNAAAAELKGLEAGLPDHAVLEAERAQAGERLEGAQQVSTAANRKRAAADEALGRETPKWKSWEERRDRSRSLEADRAMAALAVQNAVQEIDRINKALAEALRAKAQLAELADPLAPIGHLKEELGRLEELQRHEEARRAEQAQLEELARTQAELEARLRELGSAEATLAQLEREATTVIARVRTAEQAIEEERTTWVRDRQDAETKRLQLREQYKEVKEQRDLIAGLGPEGVCPTCKRPLGSEHATVVEVLDRQLEDITINGQFFKQRVDQLELEPASLRAAEAERDKALAAERAVTEQLGTVRAQLDERDRAAEQRTTGAARAAEIAARLAARPTGYDRARHEIVRAELTRLEPLALEAAVLEAKAKTAESLVQEAEQAEAALSRQERRAKELADAIAAQGFSEPQFAKAKERYERLTGALREAELEVLEARGALIRAEEVIAEVDRRLVERQAREREIAERKVRLRLHNELDRAFSDLRAELNAAMRPEIAELASGFLADLTDGRYDAIDLGEDYRVTILDEGIPKAVISGGEEDLANLVLRLAISQMIAERAGQPLSLLVLDEIFGSLDESRRQHVLSLLRRLGDRFPQVILITHIDQVREGLDRVIRVDYDATAGTSVVRDDTATLAAGGVDAGVAA